MINGLRAMMCGACGEQRHVIHTKDNDFYLECIECESVTKLSISIPKIKIGWVDGSDGILCKLN